MTRWQFTRYLIALFALPAALVLLVLLAGWIGSSIPRNADWREPDIGVTLMIESNGVHTGIVMPVVSAQKDWRETFPSAGEPRKTDGWQPTHIAVGWGEKEVFLNTPTWSDLRPSTVLRIAARGGKGLLRVASYVNPQPSDYHRTITLRPEEYRRLVAEIEATLPTLAAGEVRDSYESYELNAIHYDARGRYTLINTCNQWVSDVLAKAGVRIGYWTPFAGGVMKWVPRQIQANSPRP